MNNNPIGIFDSGIGGLSVVQEIQALLPDERIIYIADSAYAPYGNKPHSFIQQRCETLSHFLVGQQAKAIVIACNTATAVAVTTLRQQFEIPIIAMEPGVKPAIAATKSGIVGVLATENTLASEQFTRLVHRYAESVRVISQPCPGLVEQIETGEFNSDMTRGLITQYTAPLLAGGADTIVLGCTHYPLIRQQITQAVGAQVTVIDTGQAVAQQLKRKLVEQQLLGDETQQGVNEYWTSADARHIGKLLCTLLACATTVRPLPETTGRADTLFLHH